jgi:hypothetical protein
MKYSLRSLMIVVILFCVVLGGRIEYLRQLAVFHEAQVSDEFIDMGDAYHRDLAADYRKAMLRPWTPVEDPSEEMKEAARRTNAEIDAEHAKKLTSLAPAPNPPQP